MGLLRQNETETLIINYCCWKMEGGELDEITSIEYDHRLYEGYPIGRRELWIGVVCEYTRDLFITRNGRKPS